MMIGGTFQARPETPEARKTGGLLGGLGIPGLFWLGTSGDFSKVFGLKGLRWSSFFLFFQACKILTCGSPIDVFLVAFLLSPLEPASRSTASSQ